MNQTSKCLLRTFGYTVMSPIPLYTGTMYFVGRYWAGGWSLKAPFLVLCYLLTTGFMARVQARNWVSPDVAHARMAVLGLLAVASGAFDPMRVTLGLPTYLYEVSVFLMVLGAFHLGGEFRQETHEARRF